MTDFPKPSAYTPFFRRFTDERARELEETRALYARIRAHHERLPYTPISIGAGVYEFIRDAPLRPELCVALDAIIKQETFIFDLPEPHFETMSLQEFVEFRNLLRYKEYFFQNEAKVAQLLHEGLARVFCGIAEVIPKIEAPSPFTIPLIYALPNPHVTVDKIYATFVENQYLDHGLFRELTDRMYRNLCDASGIVPNEKSKKPFKNATDSDLPLDRLNDQYLSGTPFHELFTVPVALKLTHDERFNHMHVVGGTGAGKTTLLENLILHDLTSDDPPSLVIIDSQGDLIRKLSHLSGDFTDRIILINPKDIQFPPAINIFDLNRARLNDYDEATKEQVVAGVIQTFDYLFTGLLGADLTAKQGVFFRFVARLMLSLPETLGRNATILDMLRLMTDDAPYREAINRLPDIPREFFLRDFPSKTFAQTKEQIRYRLNAILENPTLARLFTSTETKVDFFAELNRGSILLIDTAKDFLKGASSHFGRIFISLILQAVLERAALPERERKDTFLIVDEAAAYFDSNIDDLLTDARKYKCGCVFAHQYLDQCTPSLRASLAANTSIKFASGVSTNDARAMATDMRTTADFILGQPRLQFAAHIRNVTPQAVSIPVAVGVLEQRPQLSLEAYEQFRELNRVRVSLPRDIAGGDSTMKGRPASGGARSKAADDPAAPSADW